MTDFPPKHTCPFPASPPIRFSMELETIQEIVDILLVAEQTTEALKTLHEGDLTDSRFVQIWKDDTQKLREMITRLSDILEAHA